MKKFFEKVKLDSKFKKAGEGHKLTDERPQSSHVQSAQPRAPVRDKPITEPQANAAVAALERHEKLSEQAKPKKKIRLPPEPSASAIITPSTSQSPETCKKIVEQNTKSQEHFSVDGVKFISAMTGEIFPKSELNDHYRECLIMKLGSDEAILASCQMIRTLNKHPEKVEVAVNTMCKYIDNLIKNENEEKFRRIRKGNKAFCERVAILEGTEEFLKAIGFQLKSLQSNEQEELFFVFSGEVDGEKLEEYKNMLMNTKPLVSKLHRNRKVYKSSDHAIRFHLPNDFYNLTMEEVKKEQIARTETVELEKQLRTKAMREAGRQTRKYNFALIRIRFPDGYLLQGTFGVYEKLSDLRQFISESLNVEWAPFFLKTSLGKVIDRDGETLKDLSLCPSVLLNLSWEEDVKDQILREQGVKLSLQKELLDKIEIFM